jgi:hypothetical protein
MSRMGGRGGGVLWAKHGALLGDEPPHWSPMALEAGRYVIQCKGKNQGKPPTGCAKRVITKLPQARNAHPVFHQ